MHDVVNTLTGVGRGGGGRGREAGKEKITSTLTHPFRKHPGGRGRVGGGEGGRGRERGGRGGGREGGGERGGRGMPHF